MGQETAAKEKNTGAAGRSWNLVIGLIAAFGVFHFCGSLLTGGMFFIVGPLSLGFTAGYVFQRAGSILWPYVVLLAFFAGALVLAKKHRAASAAILALALAASASTCIYDLHNDRFRFTVQKSSGPQYYNAVWWWWRR